MLARAVKRVLRSSVRPLHTPADLQRAHWNVYVASGRGSAALFGSIDSDADGFIQHDEIRTFVDAIETSNHIMERALQRLDETAETEKIDLATFQRWLIDATHFAGYQDARGVYDMRPDVGRRKTTEGTFAWNQTTMSQSLRRMQYAVRGEVVIKADELRAQGKEIIYTNIGNPHSVGQKPSEYVPHAVLCSLLTFDTVTYYRQVSALCDLPAESGVDHPMVFSLFPSDVVDHARVLRDIIGPSGTGAYTNSQGLVGFRRHVVQYLQDRDGHEAFEGDIFLTNGASAGIEMVLSAIISTDFDAVVCKDWLSTDASQTSSKQMVPIPQYPIYSALIARLAGREIGYELDEERGWAITEEELYKQLNDAKAKGVTVRALALINPGNPTGQLMGVEQLEMVGKFCVDNGIVLLADEVYQRNVYSDDKQFISMKKVAVESPHLSNLELVSFHSTSKGLIGECGRRGGYMELHNIDPYVQSQVRLV